MEMLGSGYVLYKAVRRYVIMGDRISGQTAMNEYCWECRLHGDDYSYDKDGDIVYNCYDCPMNPRSDAWRRGDGNETN